jgi:hypothetical protein
MGWKYVEISIYSVLFTVIGLSMYFVKSETESVFFSNESREEMQKQSNDTKSKETRFTYLLVECCHLTN